MKSFLVMLVLFAAGLAGVLYWRQTLRAPKAPVASVGPEPKKTGKVKRRRRRRGARRLARGERIARNGTAVDLAPPSRAAPGEAPAPVFDQQTDDRAPVAPGGAATTEAEPDDVFGESSSAPVAAAPSGGGNQQVDEPEPIKLRPADLKIVWQGPDLSKTETMRLDFSSDSGGHELTDDEIDTRFRSKESAVLACVARARPDEYTYVPGRVTVRFRIERNGSVKSVQVEAPVILHKGGLTGCIKGVMTSLHFPASSTGQVVSYPFSLM